MIPALFQQIAAVNPTLHGWCSDQRAFDIAAAVVALRPKKVVVVGVFGGRDTIAPALACRAVGGGQVIGIDPWKSEDSVQGQIEAADRNWWNDQEKHEEVYHNFLNRLNELGLGSDWVDVRRQRSDDVEPPKEVGIAIIDGNHSDQAVKDVQRFCAEVVVGGMAYIDDIGWAGGGVKKSVDLLLTMGFVEIYKRDGGAWFQRVGR